MIVDDVGCSTWNVCAGGEFKRSMSVNMVLEYKQASLEDRNYGQRNVGV